MLQDFDKFHDAEFRVACTTHSRASSLNHQKKYVLSKHISLATHKSFTTPTVFLQLLHYNMSDYGGDDEPADFGAGEYVTLNLNHLRAS